MPQTPDAAKRALVLAAGELFAERGFEGVGVRAIARNIGANTAAVNYHFGSKEALYAACVRYAIGHGVAGTVAELLPRAVFLRTPQSMADALAHVTRVLLLDYQPSEDLPWRPRLLLRTLVEQRPAARAIAEEIFGPDVEALRCFARRARPDIGDEEAVIWAFAFLGQVAFHALTEPALLSCLGRESCSLEFLAKAAATVARWAAASLGLPEPAGRGPQPMQHT